MLQSRLNRQEDLTAATKRADALARELNLAVSRAKEDLAAYKDEIENLKKVSWSNVKVDCFSSWNLQESLLVYLVCIIASKQTIVILNA